MVLNVADGEKEKKEEGFAEIPLPLPGEGINMEDSVDVVMDRKKRKEKNCSVGYAFSISLNIAFIVLTAVLVHRIMDHKQEIETLKSADEFEVIPSAVVERDENIDVNIAITGSFREWIIKENGISYGWYKNKKCQWFVRWSHVPSDNWGYDADASDVRDVLDKD